MIADLALGERVDDLVGLLDQIRHQRLQGLLAVPGAAARSQQALHQANQLLHLGAGLFSGQRRQIRMRGRIGHSPNVHIDGAAGACYIENRVERSSNRPRRPRGAAPPGTSDVVTERLALDDNQVALAFYGERNANLKLIAEATATTVHSRGNEVTLVGHPDAVALARALVEQLYAMVHRGTPLHPQDIGRAAEVLRADRRADLREVFSDTILVAGRARPIAPKGLAQKRYVDAIRNHDIVFGIGPAGTGKTYLAMALAIRALMEKQVKRIILTRPGGGGRANAWGSCPAAWKRRSRPICGRFTTRFTT